MSHEELDRSFVDIGYPRWYGRRMLSGTRLLWTIVCAVPFILATWSSPIAASPLQVVTTIPVLRDWAERIGGSHVQVTSLLSGLETGHTYAPKPSHIIAIRRAHILLQIGIGLEVWVGGLIRSAGNPDLLVVTTGEGIRLLDGSDSADVESTSSDHHDGNPHVWLDPVNATSMVGRIADAFVLKDPIHASSYRTNQEAYIDQLSALQRELLTKVRTISDRRIVVHHPAWPYFARRFGFEIVGVIVPQPGAEPSAYHLRKLIRLMRRENVRVIVAEPQLNRRLAEVLARETSAELVTLTPFPGALPGTETYLDMLRYNVTTLVDALRHH